MNTVQDTRATFRWHSSLSWIFRLCVNYCWVLFRFNKCLFGACRSAGINWSSAVALYRFFTHLLTKGCVDALGEAVVPSWKLEASETLGGGKVFAVLDWTVPSAHICRVADVFRYIHPLPSTDKDAVSPNHIPPWASLCVRCRSTHEGKVGLMGQTAFSRKQCLLKFAGWLSCHIPQRQSVLYQCPIHCCLFLLFGALWLKNSW